MISGPMTIEEAEELETVKGIFELVEAGHEHNAEYAEGQIIRQDPEAERIRKNAKGDLIPINVTISLGSRSGEMPDVVGAPNTSRIMISIFHQLLLGLS